MEPLLRMKNICKSFSSIPVLKNVDLEVYPGEVVALLGENGAGKSTLIKILGGAYTKDAGEIYVSGEKTNITNVDNAKKNGISIIHQELMLIPHMSIAENIFMGTMETNKFGMIDRDKMSKKAENFIKTMGLDLNPDALVGDLNIAQQQMVEIIKAISFGAKIIVMDEPTSSLTESEVDILFNAINDLKSKGVGIVYISHRMAELDIIADRITILRDGEYVTTVDAKDTTHDELISYMVGRQIKDLYSKNNHSQDEIILKVENLASGKHVHNASFDLYKGEVLGFSGLVGSGRTETMCAIFGLTKKDHGNIWLEGKPVNIKNIKNAIELGLGLVPEDRKKEGIFPVETILFNTTINQMSAFLNYGLCNPQQEYDLAIKYIDNIMQTKYANIDQAIQTLSGGNQQKVIISRWLLCTRKILILDEPTRGIDIKTKSDIYHLIDELTSQGLSVIFISSEMPELINMCDRIVVMNQGVTTGTLERKEFSQEKIMALSTKEIS